MEVRFHLWYTWNKIICVDISFFFKQVHIFPACLLYTDTVILCFVAFLLFFTAINELSISIFRLTLSLYIHWSNHILIVEKNMHSQWVTTHKNMYYEITHSDTHITSWQCWLLNISYTVLMIIEIASVFFKSTTWSHLSFASPFQRMK